MNDSNSELKILNDTNDIVIICFGGLALSFDGILPFEFLNFLSNNYNNCDLIFYRDFKKSWYHNGLEGITNNIEETIEHINNIINQKIYKKIIFMGISAGGYAAILFGSLCKNVTNVVSFIPQTILKNPINKKYSNLKIFINKTTKYLIYGDINGTELHNISHCTNIEDFDNVELIKCKNLNIKKFRDDGTFNNIINSIIL